MDVPWESQAPQALAPSEVILLVIGVGNSSWRRTQSQGRSHSVVTCHLSFHNSPRPAL